MIEYLEKLLDDGEFEKALAFAEQLLRDGANDVQEMVAIHSAIVAARINLKDYTGAVVAGNVAMHLAKEICAWDSFGALCMNIGAGYYYLREWHQAISVWVDFLTALNYYQKCTMFEATVRYNLGLAYVALGEFSYACNSMEQAISAANRRGNADFANGIRLALIGALLKAGNLAPIPRLLVQCKKYIRNHHSDNSMLDTGLWQTSLRIEYTIATNRLDMARRLALRAACDDHARSDHQFAFHMMLARVARRRGFADEALAHSFAARIHAERCHRHDLLAEADDFTSEMAVDPASLTRILAKYLLDSGLPFGAESDGLV